jgi:hypothetical protein
MITPRINQGVLALTLMAIGLAPVTTSAQQPATPSERDYQVITISSKCGSRSLHSSYRKAEGACSVADQLRSEGRGGIVEIVTGVGDKPIPVPPSCVYEVYRKPCKGDWTAHSSYRSLHEAVQAASEIARSGDKFEIITRYGW